MKFRTQAGVTRSDLTELVKLVERGFALVELPFGKKKSLEIGWNLAQNVITRANDVEKLRGKNVGLAHAYCSPQPTCAVDVDDYRLARKWLSNAGFGLKAELLRPESVVLTSGQPYKIKLLYKLPRCVNAIPSIKISSANDKTILEFRCGTRNGRTVQDLIPPSIHPYGSRYRWLGGGSPLDLPTIPRDLLTIWERLLVTSHRHQNPHSRNATPATPLNIALAEDALTNINADCGYDVWRNVVWALLSTGWQNAEAIARVWSKTAPQRYDEVKFQLLVDSYDPSIENSFTLGTVYYYARRSGWNG